ncbi:CDP-glycerol:glycerophosphate glycerophosphotransferase, partial [Streptomyces sp. SID14478]|uniref:CDP-glycerol glycerophosphotransferase family protein n=1 Tax=Streptomyces sp. SID14478 TaxID=2706073 RepID=UPI00141178CA
LPGPAGTLPLAEGNWYLYLRAVGDSDPERRVPVLVATARHPELPLTRTLGGRDFLVQRRHHDQLLLSSGSSLPETDRGRGAQAALRTGYATQRTLPRRDAVLYISFDGRQHSDSPRAVFDELAARGIALEHLWVVRDQQVELPAGATPVALWSAAWYEALARCRYVVTNTHLPEWFERAEGQYVVQTWHGTPLKRIGRDLLGSVSADPKYIATLPARADQWSLLVSPNSFSTPVLRSAFGYTGDVLASGYPRNDLLHDADRDKHAASVRERLGVPDGKRVILYAPTWRENQPRRSGRYGLDLQLDLAAAEAALGDDHVLLVRRHYLVGGAVPTSEFVRDVSRHPDAAELLLIADVLVTDYSSMMFDFAQTGRPMLFHTYDLDHYRDTLRGFYFDFSAQAPGPLLRTSDEVIAALLDPDAAVAGHREAYGRFREAFCDLDDGSAAAQVADAMLAHGADGGRR